ncbi:hypothetical protein J6590_034261 [Homalodisca vitripennis]|nr:hypothetical protein J6590_034261 [Homalodisca vitripennis]
MLQEDLQHRHSSFTLTGGNVIITYQYEGDVRAARRCDARLQGTVAQFDILIGPLGSNRVISYGLGRPTLSRRELFTAPAVVREEWYPPEERVRPPRKGGGGEGRAGRIPLAPRRRVTQHFVQFFTAACDVRPWIVVDVINPPCQPCGSKHLLKQDRCHLQEGNDRRLQLPVTCKSTLRESNVDRNGVTFTRPEAVTGHEIPAWIGEKSNLETCVVDETIWIGEKSNNCCTNLRCG